MGTAPTIPTHLNDSRLICIDNIANNNEVYALAKSINSDINFIYSQLKSMRIRCSTTDRIYIDSMLSIIKGSKV